MANNGSVSHGELLLTAALNAGARLPWKIGVLFAVLSFGGLHYAGLYSPFVAHPLVVANNQTAQTPPAEAASSAQPTPSKPATVPATQQVAVSLPAALAYLLQFVIPPGFLIGAVMSAYRARRRRTQEASNQRR
jgi:hypothetical protein